MLSIRIVVLFFLVILPVPAKDSPSLPKPGQVDNPGMTARNLLLAGGF